MVTVEEKLHVRSPFTARAEVIRENISTVLTTRLEEISLHGCYLEYIPVHKTNRVLVKLSAQGDFFEASATVIYSHPSSGTALAFRSIQPHFTEVLRKWCRVSVQKESTAIGLQFVNGSVRMILNNVLHLEAPYKHDPVAPTLETDLQLRRWADYLQKTNSDDSAARFFGKSAFEADGFRQGKDTVWRRD
jgi:hypothetical protein